MDIFDKIGETANKTYKYTAQKTSKFAKETKLKLQISEDRAKIEDIYEEIGKKVYGKHIREENIDIKKDLYEECSKIDKIANSIEKARKEILSLKDRRQCEKCAKEIDLCFKYCPECGYKQTEEQAREVEILENLENTNIPKNKEEEANIIKKALEEETDTDSN